MIERFAKDLRLILFVIFFGILGVIYNQNVPDEWFVRYDLKQSQNSEIILKSIDQTILGVSKFYVGNKRFDEHVGIFLADYEADFKILENYSEKNNISEIKVSKSYLSFITSEIKTADEIAERIIAQTNKDLIKSIQDRIEYYREELTLNLRTEKIYKVEDLERRLEYYKDKKVTPLSLSPSASMTIDNYILAQDDEATRQFVKDLKEDLIQYEFYNAIQKFELELKMLNEREVTENPALVNLNVYKDKISKENIFIIKGKEKLFNKKPSLKFSILTFGIIGLVLNFVIIFFWVNRKILKKLKLEKLLTLPNLK